MSFTIKAVHDKNLEQYLESLGVLDDVKEGKYLCSYCGKTITLDNLQCVYPFKDEIRICCDNPDCYQKALNDFKGDSNDS